jgi:hypothetical protein
MEERVNIYYGRKLELISIFAYFLDDWEWSIIYVVQLLLGLVGGDVPSIEPDSVSRAVCQIGSWYLSAYSCCQS